MFPNFGTDGATAGTKDYYYDDVEFVAPVTPVLSQVDLPITFEDTLTVDYALVDFGGTASDIVVDPSSVGNTVVKVIKTGTAQTWGGTTFGGTGLASAIPFNSNATKIKMMVYSPDAGTHIRLKAENAANGALSVETEALTTIANAWDTLEFDFSNPAGGTQQLNLSTVYNKLSVFPNFGTDGATAGSKTYYFDNVMFVPGSGPVLNQVSLPTNFDSSNVAYSLVDFGGNASLIDADPVTPSNKVLKATKTNGAQTWAGTTIGGTAGFISAIPFTINATKMSMDIYSPDAGVHVRMKAEDPNDPTHSVETEAITTVANTWETLEFNFANQATGTAAINFSYNYQKLSLFFNFGTDGATAGAKTYYADNIVFGSFVGVKKVDKSNIKLLATKGGIQLISSDVAQVDQIEIYDVVGKQIYFSNQKIAANTLVPVSFNASTLYLIKLKVNNQQQTFKVVITE